MTDKAGMDWSLATWKGSRLQQHREFLTLPFRRKLEELEEMNEWATRTLESRKAQGLPYIDPDSGELVKNYLTGEP